MIRVQMIRQDTRHPDRRRRHQGRAWCEAAGRRFEAQGPAPIYKLTTLLWLHGHGGAGFEVWGDLSPIGEPGGLAMRGQVRNWARLVKGKPTFGKDAPCETDFSSGERDMVAQAGRPGYRDRLATARECPYSRNSPLGRPRDHPQERDRACTALSWPQTPEAA